MAFTLIPSSFFSDHCIKVYGSMCITLQMPLVYAAFLNDYPLLYQKRRNVNKINSYTVAYRKQNNEQVHSWTIWNKKWEHMPDRSAYPGWLAAPTKNACDTASTHTYDWMQRVTMKCHSHNTPEREYNNTWVNLLWWCGDLRCPQNSKQA